MLGGRSLCCPSLPPRLLLHGIACTVCCALIHICCDRAWPTCAQGHLGSGFLDEATTEQVTAHLRRLKDMQKITVRHRPSCAHICRRNGKERPARVCAAALGWRRRRQRRAVAAIKLSAAGCR
eukprot:SAG11_NODE_2770_length_2990_cov_7.803250_3_plen_123_part_00